MKHINACRLVSRSMLMDVIIQRFGQEWHKIHWIRMMLAGYVGALEGAKQIDDVLDEMEDAAVHIESGSMVRA